MQVFLFINYNTFFTFLWIFRKNSFLVTGRLWFFLCPSCEFGLNFIKIDLCDVGNVITNSFNLWSIGTLKCYNTLSEDITNLNESYPLTEEVSSKM